MCNNCYGIRDRNCTGFGWNRVNFLHSSFTVLCFGFVTKPVLVTQGGFSCSWEVLVQCGNLLFFLLRLPHQEEGGGAQEVGRQHSQEQLTPRDPKDISYHMISHPVYKAQRRRRKWRAFEVMVFVYPSHCYMWWSPALVEMAEHLPAHGKQWMNSLFCFACMHSFCSTY